MEGAVAENGKKRRPTARDRDIADYVLALPPGIHTIVVQHFIKPPIKAEGGLVVLDGDRNWSFLREIK
jgi:hypothetical protein